MTKTICICDVTGREGAVTFVYPDGGTQIDPASGRTEYIERTIDLSHEAAMQILVAVSERFDKHHSTYTMSREEFAAIVKGVRKEWRA